MRRARPAIGARTPPRTAPPAIASRSRSCRVSRSPGGCPSRRGTMRIGLIQVMQETCSFNPTPTTLADFESFGILEGAEMLERSDRVGPVGGYLDVVARSATPIE